MLNDTNKKQVFDSSCASSFMTDKATDAEDTKESEIQNQTPEKITASNTINVDKSTQGIEAKVSEYDQANFTISL